MQSPENGDSARNNLFGNLASSQTNSKILFNTLVRNKVLDMPELLSPIITKRLKYLSLPNPPIKWSTNEGGLKFDGFMWKRNKSGELVDAISILFDREIWESRILNVKLGKIGECLDYGIA